MAAGLSYAEITRASNEALKDALINEALKDALIHERPRVRETDIRTMLEERKSVAEKPRTSTLVAGVQRDVEPGRASRWRSTLNFFAV